MRLKNMAYQPASLHSSHLPQLPCLPKIPWPGAVLLARLGNGNWTFPVLGLNLELSPLDSKGSFYIPVAFPILFTIPWP